MNECLKFMVSLAEFEGDIYEKGPIEKADTILKKSLESKGLLI